MQFLTGFGHKRRRNVPPFVPLPSTISKVQSHFTCSFLYSQIPSLVPSLRRRHKTYYQILALYSSTFVAVILLLTYLCAFPRVLSVFTWKVHRQWKRQSEREIESAVECHVTVYTFMSLNRQTREKKGLQPLQKSTKDMGFILDRRGIKRQDSSYSIRGIINRRRTTCLRIVLLKAVVDFHGFLRLELKVSVYFFLMVYPKVGGRPKVYPQAAGAT